MVTKYNKGNNMDYDLTKVGPVCSEEPVMVMVRDISNEEWEGPYALVGKDKDNKQCYWVWDDKRNAPECYTYVELYKEPEKTTRPMNIEEVVQLVKDGAGFKLDDFADTVHFPLIGIEASGKLYLNDGIHCSYPEDVRYFLDSDEPRKLEVEVISE